LDEGSGAEAARCAAELLSLAFIGRLKTPDASISSPCGRPVIVNISPDDAVVSGIAPTLALPLGIRGRPRPPDLDH
jgi:hypothetical protein